MGGCGGDKWSLIPQCRACHDRYEAGKKTFRRWLLEEKGIELHALPAIYQDRYARIGGWWRADDGDEW